MTNLIGVERITNEITAIALVVYDDNITQFIESIDTLQLKLFKMVIKNNCIHVEHFATTKNNKENVNMDFHSMYTIMRVLHLIPLQIDGYTIILAIKTAMLYHIMLHYFSYEVLI